MTMYVSTDVGNIVYMCQNTYFWDKCVRFILCFFDQNQSSYKNFFFFFFFFFYQYLLESRSHALSGFPNGTLFDQIW